MNQRQFENFRERLIHNHRGEGFSEHLTPDPIFLVQQKVQFFPDTGEYYWDYVCAHLTSEAAQQYLDSNGHRHGGELRIYADSQSRCHEYNGLLKAIMDGKLAWNCDKLQEVE